MWCSLGWVMMVVVSAAAEPGASSGGPACAALEGAFAERNPAVAEPAVPLTGRVLASAIGREMGRWKDVSGEQAVEAARSLFVLYLYLEDDLQLTNARRKYYGKLLRNRLVALCDQITQYAAGQKPGAEAQPPAASGGTGAGFSAGPRAAAPDHIALPAGVLAQRIGGRGGGPSLFGKGRTPGGPLATQIPDSGLQLVELIQSVIAPNTWAQNGGRGTIHYWRAGRALIIRQTDEVHRQVSGALEQLRRAGN